MNEILTYGRTVPTLALSSDVALARDEPQRLRTLESYEILDSAPEKSYDDVARLAAFICGAPISLISFIDRDRQWIKARFSSGGLGDKPQNLPRSAAFCDTAIQHPDELIVVPDMAQSPPFAQAPLTTGSAKLRFYAATPLVAPAGEVLGTLAVMDRRTRSLSPDQANALETLGRQVMELLEMRRTVIGLSVANARLGQQNITDALTGIPNRRAFDQRIIAEYARAKRTGSPLCLLLIDIDRFKLYNDTFGHLAGDSALQSVSRVLLASLRPYDFLARYGGEEFAILLPGTDLRDAVSVAERVRGLVAGSEFPHRKFTVSIGVAKLDTEVAAGLKAMLQMADDGLYRAKAGGRNRVAAGELNEPAAT